MVDCIYLQIDDQNDSDYTCIPLGYYCKLKKKEEWGVPYMCFKCKDKNMGGQLR